jgi:hypothetical protein
LVLAIVTFALLRTDARYAEAPKWYWVEKLCWPPTADVVIAGDSRVYRGVDPSMFTEPIGDAVNFGFSSGKLTREYIDHAASLFSLRGERVLVMGITLFAIQYDANDNNGFSHAQRDLARLRLPFRFARAVEEWEIALQPIAIDARSGEAGHVRAMADEYAQVFHSNGWIESDRRMADPVANGIAIVRQSFPDGVRTKADTTLLLACVRDLISQGIRVVAFRPPIPQEVAALEDAIGFIDYESLASQLNDIGATWVDLEWTDLRSYDGSHVDGSSASELSRRLAAEIGAVLRPTLRE